MLTSFFFFFKSILRSNWNRILFLKQKKLSILKSNLKLKIVPFLKSIYFLKFIFKKQKKIHSLESEWSPLQICSLWNINLKFVFIPKSSKIKSHWNSIISVFFCVLLNTKQKADFISAQNQRDIDRFWLDTPFCQIFCTLLVYGIYFLV